LQLITLKLKLEHVNIIGTLKAVLQDTFLKDILLTIKGGKVIILRGVKRAGLKKGIFLKIIDP